MRVAIEIIGSTRLRIEPSDRADAGILSKALIERYESAWKRVEEAEQAIRNRLAEPMIRSQRLSNALKAVLAEMEDDDIVGLVDD